MASEYDSLLEEPPQQSEYDALLTPEHEERSIPSKIGHAVVDTLKSFVPQSFEEAALAPVKALPGVGKVGTILSNIAFGKPIAEGLDPLAGIPVVQRIPEIIAAEKTPAGSQERFTTAAGTLLDLGMIAGLKAAPEIAAKPKPLVEVAGIERPSPTTPVTPETPIAATEPVAAEPDLTAVNRELAPQTEPPSATEIQEPFPSISQSAETQRRAELQTEQPTPVRQALSLDELRLMRERNELQLQNDIAQKVTGGTHPAVDERLGQIDEELTTIANRELQTEGGGEINAQQISEPAPIDGNVLNIPRSEEGTGQVPADVSSEGVQARGQGEVVQQTAPEVVPVDERVQSGQFEEKGYTAIPTETETAPVSDQQHVSTIANRFTQERTAAGELGEIAPGQGYSTREMAAQGLKMQPEEVNQHVSDLMQGTGDPIKQGMAVRAEEARLDQRNSQLSRLAEDNPNNVQAKIDADNALKDVTDFHKGPVAKLKTIFHATGESLQGELPMDLSTYNGQRAAWLKNTGELPPVKMESAIRQSVKRVRQAVDEDLATKRRLGQEIDKAVSRRKLPTVDEVRQNITDRMKEPPCRI